MLGRSILQSKAISRDSKNGLNVEGIYKLLIVNEGTTTITVSDTVFGDIDIKAGLFVNLDGHPSYPFDVALTITFLPIAIPTDTVRLIYTRVYYNK